MRSAADAKPAPAAVTQAVAKPAMEKLIPHGTQGKQESIPLNAEQTRNAEAIVAATKKAGMNERAAVIAIGTALQESKLENLGHLGAANDHDSQGLFQQRPTSGWGTVEQITNPEYSTTAFLNGLKNVDGWQDLPRPWPPRRFRCRPTRTPTPSGKPRPPTWSPTPGPSDTHKQLNNTSTANGPDPGSRVGAVRWFQARIIDRHANEP